MNKRLAFKEITELIKKDKVKTQHQLNKAKRDIVKKYSFKKIPTNIELLLSLPKNKIKEYKIILLTKPTRTISGVAPIAIMSKPLSCPHAKSGVGPCIMCPGGVGSVFGDVPQSYTGREPATMRGIRNKYDSYLQVFNRLEQYVLLGHCIDKIELILMGGTFPSFPVRYQEEFVWGAFKALNDFSKMFFAGNNARRLKVSGTAEGGFDWVLFKEFFELPVSDLGDEKRVRRIQKKLLKLKGKFNSRSLLKEQLRNEKAKVRGVALCIETRPDYCGEKEVREMLNLGCTRVELGVQHLDDKVLKRINRGHGVKEVIEATKLLKDSFLKVGFHVMPGLLGSSIFEDKKMLVELFKKSKFKPDALKIYPCMVTKGTKLYGLWKKGEYKPLDTRMAAKLIAWFKERIPEYCRVLRVQRDIPTYQTVAGVDMTNLRQYIHEKFKVKCRCIRCREPKNEKIDLKTVIIKIRKYRASEGEEYFISVEDSDEEVLLGFCRLRIVDGQAGIRELHVYGVATGIGEKGLVQHKGLGKKLLNMAEGIVKENCVRKVKVISGVGVKDYYKKFGYKKDGVYMSKVF